MNIIKPAIQSSGLSVHINAKKDINIKDMPAIKIFLLHIFLYEWTYAIRTATRDMSPQKRRNTGEAYPILSEKTFKESIIKIIEANLRIAMMVPFGDAIMNLSSINHSIVNINLPAKIWQLMVQTIMEKVMEKAARPTYINT